MENTKMLLKTRGIKKSYYTNNIETLVLNDVNLEINEGDFVAIMGPSGCGKSTLLNIIGLLDNPSGGEFYFNNLDTSMLKEKKRTDLRKLNIGFVFQSFNLIDELTVFENIELPLIYLKYSSSERKKRVVNIMESMNIAHRKKSFSATAFWWTAAKSGDFESSGFPTAINTCGRAYW